MTMTINFIRIILACIIAFPVIGQDFLGEFETDPEVLFGFSKPFSEREKKVIARLSWKLNIDENYITITMNRMGEKTAARYPYIVDGKFLLATNNKSDATVYIPFYVENPSTVHGYSVAFFRAK